MCCVRDISAGPRRAAQPAMRAESSSTPRHSERSLLTAAPSLTAASMRAMDGYIAGHTRPFLYFFFLFFTPGSWERLFLAKHSDKYTWKQHFLSCIGKYRTWIHKQCLLLLKMSFFLNSRRVLIITTQQRSTVLPCSLTLKALRIMVRLNLMFLHT